MAAPFFRVYCWNESACAQSARASDFPQPGKARPTCGNDIKSCHFLRPGKYLADLIRETLRFPNPSALSARKG